MRDKSKGDSRPVKKRRKRKLKRKSHDDSFTILDPSEDQLETVCGGEVGELSSYDAWKKVAYSDAESLRVTEAMKMKRLTIVVLLGLFSIGFLLTLWYGIMRNQITFEDYLKLSKVLLERL